MSGRALRRRCFLLGAVALLALLLLIVGAVLELPALVAIGGLALPASALALYRLLAPTLPSQAALLRGELHALLLLGQLLVLVHILRADLLSTAAEQVVVLAIVTVEGLRAVHTGLSEVDGRLRLRRAELRNLSGPGGPLPTRPRLLGSAGVLTLGAAGMLLPAALIWTVLTGSRALLLPAVVLTGATALAVVAAVLPAVLAVACLPRGKALLRGVHDAVLAHDPALILYSTGGPDDLHWITPWLRVLEDLKCPAVILLRQRGTIDLVPPTSTPLVCLPEAVDVLPFRLPNARVALFVANGPENLRLLRNPAVRSAFIGHGDSDKSSSANPTVKMYDEVWVAGEAGRQRYVDAGVGLRPEQLRIVGRPQVQGVRSPAPRPANTPYAVLYAPTWEGVQADPYESSLAHSGREIVQALLAADDVRVVFRPHPATGRRSAAHASASRDIQAMLAEGGPQHRTVLQSGPDLYTCFNEADALVADISGVVSDFLASNKPYFIVNGAGLPDEEFRARNPSAAGAYLVGPAGAGLAAALADARGRDSMRDGRREVRRLLIGPPTRDPVGVFASAIDALAATAPRSR